MAERSNDKGSRAPYKIVGRKYSDTESYKDWDAEKKFPVYEEIKGTEQVFEPSLDEVSSLDEAMYWMAKNHPGLFVGMSATERRRGGDFVATAVPSAEAYEPGTYETQANREAYANKYAERYEKALKNIYDVELYGETYEVNPYRSTYRDNDSLAVMLKTTEGEPFATLTVNLDESYFLPEDMAFVDTNNCPWAEEFLSESRLAKSLNNFAESGYCRYPLYKFDLDRIPDISAPSKSVDRPSRTGVKDLDLDLELDLEPNGPQNDDFELPF